MRAASHTIHHLTPRVLQNAGSGKVAVEDLPAGRPHSVVAVIRHWPPADSFRWPPTLMCRLHLDHISHLQDMIAKLDTQIGAMMAPFRIERDLLTTIPGIAELTAAAVISEISAGVTEYFPDAAHLASWAGLCPGNNESAGKRRSGKRRHGNPHLQATLVEAAWPAVRHEGYLKALYHRHFMKWGGYRSPTAKKKAIIVVAHALLVIIWHIRPPAGPTASSARTTSPAAWTPAGKPGA
jgi:transposase